MIDTPHEMFWAAVILVTFSVAFVLTMIPVSDWFAKRARERKLARKFNRARGIR